MSLAYLRSDALTKLANCGREALDKVEATTREILSEIPGPWMPDDIVTSLELVEMAHSNANAGGKNLIVLALRRIIDDLGRAWLKRSVSLSESRQLLSAMELGVAWRGQSKGFDSRLVRLLWEAKSAPILFSSRITATPEIVGEEENSVVLFVHSLWDRLPKAAKSQQESFAKHQGLNEDYRKLLATWVSVYKSKPGDVMKSSVLSDLHFFTSRIEGKPGIIQLNVGDQTHLVAVCPIIGGNDALEVANDSSELQTFFKMLGRDVDISKTPTLKAGNLEIHDHSRLNVIEGAYSHARNHFLDLMAEVTVAQISHEPSAASIDAVAAILWHKAKKSEIADLPKAEADVYLVDPKVICQATEVTESFGPVLTSVDVQREVQGPREDMFNSFKLWWHRGLTRR